MAKQILMILAPGFEETEAIATADVLVRLQYQVLMVGMDGLDVKGSHGIAIHADSVLSDAPFDTADAIVLPGGLPGTTNLMNSTVLADKLRTARKAGKLIAAICAAPVVLKKAGLIDGMDVTGYPGAEGLLGKTDMVFNGKMTNANDGIVTGKGPGASFLFGGAIAEALGTGRSEIDNLFKGMFVLS